MKITKRQAKEALGLKSDADLARLFKVNRWAVGQWAEDAPIPDGRQWELLARFPDIFGPVPDESAVA